MASLGPQTTTFTETVNAGASGTLTTNNWALGRDSVAGSDEELFYIDTTTAGATAFSIPSYTQKSGQKCLLQLDIVENDNVESIGGSDTASTTTFQDRIKELPELIRRAAASQASVIGAAGNNLGKSLVKSVYVRVEYASHALSTN